MEDVERFNRWLSEDRGRDVIGLDIESSGLSAFKPESRIRLVQIGDYETGWAFPWDGWSGPAIEALRKTKMPIALHNANFDLKFFQLFSDWKVPWERIHDTMIMAKLCRPGKPAALKPLAAEFVDPRATVGQSLLDDKFIINGWDWNTVPVDLQEYWAYGALDPVETVHLWKHFRADKKFPEAFDQEMGVLRVCSNMELRGMPIDLEYCERMSKEITEYNHKMEKWAKEELGFSLGSPAQLVRYFEKHGARFNEEYLTAKGMPSVKADQLEEFELDPNPAIANVAKLALDARKYVKLNSTYFESFLEKHDNGYIHTNINTLGAVTGRMSSSQPNMQQVPSDSPLVKNCFIPEKGKVMLTSDLDQVEFRIFSCLSGDKALQNTFRRADANGGDAFTEIGREVYGDPEMQKSDPRRALVKTYIYSKLFGASLEKQAKSAGVSVDVMRSFAKNLNEKYPRMEEWQHEVIKEAKRSGEGQDMSHVRLSKTSNRVVPIEKGKEYVAINVWCQGSAADIMKQNLLKLDAMGYGDAMMVPVHDEIVLQVDEADVEVARREVVEAMTTDHWEVPFTADCTPPLKSWGEKYLH